MDDAEDKAILKETHGIGTEATRAGVIENLKDRGYITASKNQLAITEKGTLLCEAVAGNKMSDVAFTAEWEKYLAKI
ncbi:MAG TPA: DNA topoisomerase, partial [Trichococcus flocculiformis]|nr:DNA topoisomerase [Trichococcus flocculiformis]